MKVEDQQIFKKDAQLPVIDRMAQAMFKADWPKDDWERLGDGYHQCRYRMMAKASFDEFTKWFYNERA